MTAHKNRAGQLLTSGACKQGEHGTECDKFLAELDALADGNGTIVCHCECHPDDGCRPTIRRTRRRAQTCPGCHEVLPLTGRCDTCTA